MSHKENTSGSILKNNSQRKRKANLNKRRGSNKKSRTNRATQEEIHEVAPSQEEMHEVVPSPEEIHEVHPSQEEIHEVHPSQEGMHEVALSQEEMHIVAPSQEMHKKAPSQEKMHEEAPSLQPTFLDETQPIIVSEVQHVNNISEKMPATPDSSWFTLQKFSWMSHEVESNFVVAPVMVTVPGDLVGLFAPGAPGTVALAAAVGGAFAPGAPGNLALAAAIAPLAAAIAPLAAAIAPLAAAIVPISAQLHNHRICNRNAAAFEGVMKGSSLPAATPLFALQKEVAGAGLALPGTAPGLLPAGHPFAVGAIIPAPFPANVQAFNNLTHANICELSMMYNETFGIVAGDLHDTRLQKLQLFLSGY